MSLNWRWNSMFLKAINENEIEDKDYVLSIVKENFYKLMEDSIELNPENKIGNLIMSICLNRLLVEKFKKFAFKNNQKEIEKYFPDASLYSITDKRMKNASDSDFLTIKKITGTISTKFEKRDVVLEDQFSFSRLNYFIDHINDCLIDEIDLEQYDFYKSQYLYLTFLYFDSIHFDRFTKKDIDALDTYLDKMREGIEECYFDAFLENAKNRYYYLNPYGVLCPIKEIDELNEFIDELNAHKFDDETEKKAQEVIIAIRKFIVELKREDIPSKDRGDLLLDSDYQSLKDFFIDVRDGRIDDEMIIEEKKLENILSDVKKLIDEIRRKRD